MYRLSRNRHLQDARLPILLIAVGLIGFFVNVGAFPMRDWRSLWCFSPLILILPASELLATGHVSWRVLLIALVLVGIILTVGAFFIFGPSVVSGVA